MSQPTNDIGYLGEQTAPGQLEAAGGAVDLAPVTGPPSYATCTAATGYSSSAATTPGAEFCVRTNEGRYAYLRVRSTSSGAVVLWNPSFAGGH